MSFWDVTDPTAAQGPGQKVHIRSESLDPLPAKWSAVCAGNLRIEDGNKATRAGRDGVEGDFRRLVSQVPQIIASQQQKRGHLEAVLRDAAIIIEA